MTSTVLDFDAEWRKHYERPSFPWTVHGDVEVEMPGSIPAGAMLTIWQAGRERGREADLTFEETFLVAGLLWGQDVALSLVIDHGVSEEEFEAAVQRMLDEYARRRGEV